MAASYPGSIWAGQVTPALQSDSPTHSEIHDRVSEEIVAVQTELGTNPSGSGEATVTARFDRIDAAWTAFTPTLTNVTLGTGGAVTSRYKKDGKTVRWSGQIVLGTSGSFSGIITISTPVISANQGLTYSGHARAEDDSTGNFYDGSCTLSANSTIIGVSTGTARVAAAVPFTWAVSDKLLWSMTYETA